MDFGWGGRNRLLAAPLEAVALLDGFTYYQRCLGSGSFNAAHQRFRGGHLAFGPIAKNTLAVDEDAEITAFSSLDLRFDSKFLFGGLLQAHGCTAQVESKEAAFDFDVHGCLEKQGLGFPAMMSTLYRQSGKGGISASDISASGPLIGADFGSGIHPESVTLPRGTSPAFEVNCKSANC